MAGEDKEREFLLSPDFIDELEKFMVIMAEEGTSIEEI
jgi:hypothetical protein